MPLTCVDMKLLLVYSTFFVAIAKAATPKNTVTKLFLIDYSTPEGSKILEMTKALIAAKNETEEAGEEMNVLYEEYMRVHYPNEKCLTIKKFDVKKEKPKEENKFEHWMIIDRKCYNAARIIRVIAAFIGFTVLFVVTAMIIDRRRKNKLEAQ